MRNDRCPLILALGVSCIFGCAEAFGAAPARRGTNQPVTVVCVKLSDLTPRKATCQEWVDQLDNDVSAWYSLVSDGRVSYSFQLPTYRSGLVHPTRDWFALTLTSTSYFG